MILLQFLLIYTHKCKELASVPVNTPMHTLKRQTKQNKKSEQKWGNGTTGHHEEAAGENKF